MHDDYRILTHGARAISALAVRALYDEAGWWPERSLDDLSQVLERGPAVGAWCGDDLVGFARAVTDGHFRAYVEDVVVSSVHGGRGIATEMLEAVLQELGDVDVTSLFCSDSLVALYERSGFRATSQRVLHRKPGDAK